MTIKKFLRVVVLAVVAGGLTYLQVWWLHDADMAQQKARSEEILVQLTDGVNLIEANLRSPDYADDGKWEAQYARLLGEYQEIGYVRTHEQELADKLQTYEDHLWGRVTLARELAALRGMTGEFSERLKGDYTDAKVGKDLFVGMRDAFRGFAEGLPESSYSVVRGLLDGLKSVALEIGDISSAVADCVGVCPKGTIEGQVTKLEEAFAAANDKVGEADKQIGAELRSEELVDELLKCMEETIKSN